nr:metallophosphoesterase [uncultured Microbacterium sp.]
MQVLEHADTIVLPDLRVAICGDWHGNAGWVRTLAPAIHHLAPDVATVFQLGDWWMNTADADTALADAGITRVLVTLGNHEPWPEVTAALNTHPGSAVRVSDITWLLPRPFRFEAGGRTVLSLGGAASVDRTWRTPGRSWWPDEIVTEDNVAAANSGGTVDVMLTHEGPAGTPVNAVREVLRTNPMGFPPDALKESALSRARIAEVWNATHPSLLLHGHMHVAGGGIAPDGRRVSSLGRDTHEGNLAFLDLKTLRLNTPTLKQIRAAAEHGH